MTLSQSPVPSTSSNRESLLNFDSIFTSQFLQGRETSSEWVYHIDKSKLPNNFFKSPLSRAYICEWTRWEIAFAWVIEWDNFIFIWKSDQRNNNQTLFYLKKDVLSSDELLKKMTSIIKPLDYLEDDNFESQVFEIIWAKGISMSLLEKQIQSALQANPLTKDCFIPIDNSKWQISVLKDISIWQRSSSVIHGVRSQIQEL